MPGLTGSTISHYEILERLGAGTLGTVYKARDLDLERVVALRVLPAELFAGPDDRERVARDLAAAGTLDHPNVCQVWDVEEKDGGILVSLALCEGETLADRLARGPLRPATVADLGTQIAAGLARAHAAGLAHGRLSAGNIRLFADGQAKILDLGLAGLRSKQVPPAVAAGEGGRADLKALGELLREMLPPDAPDELRRIAMRAQAGHYSGAEELRQALRALRSSGTRPTAVAFAEQPTLREIPTSAFLGGSRLPPEVGPYRLREQLGGGGMGIIYKAEDTRLGRTVALKFLPPELTRDPVAKARFSQEARAASALDHPNICTIYDVGETPDAALFLSMPCYEGETLRDRLEQGPLPLEQAADIARQVAQGLAKAHRQGIVHRDIKPANLMLTSDGVVKILDFGIAKLAGGMGITRTGVAVGTPAYMAPEQIKGGEVDHRADLWSLGVVLYEMLAGRRPFPDENDVLAFHAVLYQEPSPLETHRPDVPPELERVVAGLLKKDPAERTLTAEDLLEELLPITGTTGLATMRSLRSLPALPKRRRRNRWAVGALAAAAAVALAALLVWRGSRSGPGPVPPFTSSRLTEQGGVERFPSLSPIGDFFIYASSADGDADIYLQRPGGDPINLTQSSPADDTQPAYSPDGSQIVFRSEREGGGLFLMGATGESVRRLADFGYNPVWSPDGKTILCATDQVEDPRSRAGRSQIRRIDLATRESRLAVPADAAQPSWSPGGQRIAYWGIEPASSRRIIWTVAAEGGTPVPVTSDASLNWNPVWSPDGRFLFFASDRSGSMDLWRVPIDEETGALRGEPIPLRVPTPWAGPMTLSKDGRRIVYATLDERTNLARVAIDPSGPRAFGDLVPVTQGSRFVSSARVSPDGLWIAFRSAVPEEDLFVVHPDGSGLRQLTDDAARDRGPVWLADGRILFFSDRSGRYEAWAIRPDGSGLEQLTETRGEPIYAPLGAPDGRRLVGKIGFTGGLALVDLTLPREKRVPVPLPGLAHGSFFAGSWSHDGSRLALVDGKQRLAVYTFATGRSEVLPASGSEPIWMRDGRRLLFRRDGRIHVLELATRQAREVLAPPLGSSFSAFDLAPDERSMVLAHDTREGDLWMLTMQDDPP